MPELILQDRKLSLDRYPLRRDDPLQPWDAADEYLLNRLREDGSDDPGPGVLIINDAFGALTAGLHRMRPTTWNDSFLFRKALTHNLDENRLDSGDITFVPGDRSPAGPFDLVVLKFPKSLAYLEDILLRLRPLLHAGSRILAGGMIKHTPARAYRLMEENVGPVKTSLGWKKARLADATFDSGLAPAGPRPADVFAIPEFGWTISGLANVFSRDHLDLGTRFLLQHLPDTAADLRAADLGCGNGILALALAHRCPAAAILGVDESYQAVASALDNLQRTGLNNRDIHFKVGDGLNEVEAGSLDLVVCNPPFHQAQTVGDQLAWTMFTQARKALRIGGELRIVGNRHLGYHVKLRRLFGNATVVASDRKFVVLSAIR